MNLDLLSSLRWLSPHTRLCLWIALGLMPFSGLLVISCGQPPAAAPKAAQFGPAAATVPAVDVRLVRRALTPVEAAAYAGGAACAECHADIARQHSHTRHDGTLRPVALADWSKAFAQTQVITDPRMGVKYTTSVADGKCLMTGTSAKSGGTISADYVIGAGKNAATFFYRMEPNAWIDLRLSYYTQARRWDFTPMQRPENSPPSDAGAPQVGERLSNCLLCHVTVLQQHDGQFDIERSLRGVGCERCHGPGRAHIEIAKRANVTIEAVRQSMEDLSRATPASINKICGECHRTAENSPPGDPHTEHDLARFQGAALARSKCYIDSGALSCITCHSPHANAQTSLNYYDSVCLQCHSGPRSALHAGAAIQARTARSVQAHPCPINTKAGCTGCHMPRQHISGIPYATYANHWIKPWKP